MTPKTCGIVGELEVGRRVCQLPVGHEGYHRDGSSHWLGYHVATESEVQQKAGVAVDPQAFPDGGGGQGMTLADWYAGQALAMLGPVVAASLPDGRLLGGQPWSWINEGEVVKCARRIGRAMVEAKAAGQ